MIHYFLETQPESIRKLAADGKLSGPEFVGQGCTLRVGSDSYGYYVAEIIKPGRLVALVDADSEFTVSCVDGDMICTMPTDKVLKNAVACSSTPNADFDYIMKYGNKWYWCGIVDGEIRRRRGAHAWLSWNGCFSYQDPSF